MAKVLKDVIESLPEEFRSLAEMYGDSLLAFSYDRLSSWVISVTNGEYVTAYKMIAEGMTTQQLIDNQKRLNTELEELNKRNAREMEVQRGMVREAMVIGLMLMRSAIIEQPEQL